MGQYFMLKSLTTALTTLAAGIMLLGIAQAQTPAANTQPATPAKTAKPATPKTPAKTPAKAATAAKPAAALTTTKDKFSYALGMQVGTGLGGNLRKQSVEFDPNILAQGLKDSLAGGKTRLTQEEAQAVLSQVQADVRKKQQAKMEVAGAANKKEGDAFLAANKSKEGVVTLPSGLQYKILTAGTGAKPASTDSVVCNYRGTLINGTEFDSSYKRKEPATFPVTGVIKGWTEALQLMPVGSKWQLFIPSGLGYGERGAGGGDIGPNATLIFEVELLSIQAKDQPKEQPKDQPADKK
jgi:FKBP-type peptidyl-prolyl cis-trans isomerase